MRPDQRPLPITWTTDQVDVTDRFKIRAGVRKDWFGTSLTLNPVPGEPNRTANDGITLVPGNTYTRNDAPTSWSAGMLYKLTPWMTPYFGVSRSYLANFNSENTAFSIGPPESALQYELGVKWSFDDGRYVLNTALFDVQREHVATPFGEDQLAFDSQRTRGGEASFDADLTSNWHVYANFTGQQAHITYSPDTPGRGRNGTAGRARLYGEPLGDIPLQPLRQGGFSCGCRH